MRKLWPPVVALAALIIAAAGIVLGSAASLPLTAQRLTVADATLAAPAQTTCTLEPVADATIDQAAPASNAGSATTLEVRSHLGANRRSLLRFDPTACGAPAGATVVSATLTLTVVTLPTEVVAYGLGHLDATWDGSTVTWNNAPGIAWSAGGVEVHAASTTATFDVVQEFLSLDTAHDGWVLHDATEDFEDYPIWTTFASSEAASDGPVLEIVYAS
jgi:hypothetical protein